MIPPFSRFLFILSLLLAPLAPALAQPSNEAFSIYLVRHAEKGPDSDNSGDPGLSECGARRAEQLSIILSGVSLEKIYSTDYRRTLKTAGPTAAARNLEVDHYDPDALTFFAETLQRREQDALVVGHSNTTGVLAGMLTDSGQEELPDDSYDRLYLVSLGGGQKRLTLLHQAFRCE